MGGIQAAQREAQDAQIVDLSQEAEGNSVARGAFSSGP
jgi:hypothetical protein